MGRGYGRRFGSARKADAGIPLRQGHKIFADDDLFDITEYSVVVIEQLVSVNRAILLEPCDDFAIVIGVVVELLRNDRRKRLHLVADVHVALGRLLDQLIG